MTEPVSAPAPIPTPQEDSKPAQAPSNGTRNRRLWIFGFIILVLAILWILYWLLYLQYHESTDDAFANGNKISINSVIPGSVIAFYADDTDLVIEGQLLIELDSIPYQVIYEKELANLAATVLQVRELYHTVEVNRAIAQSKRTQLSKAQYDFDNRSQLVKSQAISNEDYTHSKDELTIAEQDLKQAEAQLQVAQDAAGNTRLEKHALIELQKGNVRTAFYNLEHCKIYAPSTGFVALRSVDVGERVTQTTDLMAIIPTDYVWVDANYKETQLTYMRIGQPATVWFDIYGSKVQFKGKVMGIASGTGSVFSIIPPQNATGNWIKIVQRLPVRISLDPEQLKKYPTRLGISAEVDVDITNQDLPFLASSPHLRPIATTQVFKIDLNTVNKLMDEIVWDNQEKTTTAMESHP